MDKIDYYFLRTINIISNNKDTLGKILITTGTVPPLAGILLSLITKNCNIAIDTARAEVLFYSLIAVIFALYMIIIPQDVELVTDRDNTFGLVWDDEKYPGKVVKVAPIERALDYVNDPKKVVKVRPKRVEE